MPTYQIPRQSDREIIAAIGRVRKALKPLYNFEIRLNLPKGPEINLTEDEPENNKSLEFILNAGSEVLDNIYFRGPQNQTALTFNRPFEKVSDKVTIHDDWTNYVDEKIRSQLWIELLANVRRELKASELEAAFKGQEDTAWNRYRDAQAAVINSLQLTSETLLVKVVERNAQLDREREERFTKLEDKLRTELAETKTTLEKQVGDQRANLGQREKALLDREAAFETKESHYVGRQKQGEQITQIQNWLKDWHLTQGTHKKREPIFWAYVCALILTGLITVFSIWHSYDLLKTADDLAKIQWWQWVAITLKTLFPVAAFTTFMIYFIRWTGDWARQHAEEEFRNRTRLIDIGRSSWLLEAVRDSQERDKEIPADLLKELSRNLFSNTSNNDSDIHPKAAADILMQGLSSIRVKSPDGAEVEAKRGKT
jgi:hypothetical protein